MPTGFFNPAQWLELNRRSGQQMVQRVADPLAASGAGVLSDLDKAKAEFNTALGAGTLSFDPNADLATAQQRMAAGFTGPTALAGGAGWGDLSKRAGDASRDVNLLGSTGGVQELIRQRYGSANPLDAAVAQYAGGDQFRNLQSQYGDLTKALGGADTESRTAVDTAKKATETAAGQYKGLAATLGRPEPRHRPVAMQDRVDRNNEFRERRLVEQGPKGRGKKPGRPGPLGGLFDTF